MSESDTLSALRRAIAFASDGGKARTQADLFGFGHAALDTEIGGGLARGRLHEVFAREAEDAGSAAGFALMLAMRARAEAAPILWLRTEAAEKMSGRVHAPGLVELGIDPGAVLLGIMPDDVAVLKSAVDAVRCNEVGAVLIECWHSPPALDLTAGRRLTIAAEKSGVTPILLRIDAVPAPSAADTRWSVAAAASAPLPANAPGHSMMDIELLRRRAGPAGLHWRVEWNRDERIFRDPALSGAMVPLPARGPAEDHGAGRTGDFWRLTA